MPGSPRRPRSAFAALAVALAALLPVVAGAPAAHGAGAPAETGRSEAGPARGRVVVDPALPSAGDAPVAVVAVSTARSRAAAERLTVRLGGQVTRSLPLVDGFAATVPPDAVRTLATSGLVRSVTLDAPVHVQGVPGPRAGTAGHVPVHLREIGADTAWAAGSTGRGVTVALVDTGVADVPDLAGRVVEVVDDRTGRTDRCQNLSGEPGCDDSFGHGTFVAGLIAGDGTAAGGQPVGAAPQARILSVKVAGRSGATDVSTVLAAIQWVVSLRDRHGVDVLNLSLGTDSRVSADSDPLNYAVQKAWAAGITVVVSAANLGPGPGTVTKPADDPYVVTVGAVDDHSTPAVGDDRLPDFSSRGPTLDGLPKPDVVAPGTRLLSLRAPGSRLEELFPGEGAYRRGSGTSMAAGVVSGAVALLLQARPDLTPDQVKSLLRGTAREVASDDPNAVGTGLVDVPGAIAAPVADVRQDHPRSSGLGTLDGSRGSLALRLDDPAATLLTGRQTAQLLLWDPVGFTDVPWDGPTWYTTAHALAGWNATSWTGHNWGGHNWGGHNWGGHNWGGHNWGGSTWYGETAVEDYGRPTHGSAWYGVWD